MSNIQVTPDQLDDLNRTVLTEAGNVNDLKLRVRSTIDSTDWHSPAAERFRADWTSNYEAALTHLEAALRDLGSSAKVMAANYRSTEDSYQSR